MMSQFGITSMTVSVEVSDKDYGKGSGYFANLTAKTPDNDPIPMDKIDSVVDQGLSLFYTTFQTLLAGRLATGNLTSAEFKEIWGKAELRFQKVHKFLAAQAEEAPQ